MRIASPSASPSISAYSSMVPLFSGGD